MSSRWTRTQHYYSAWKRKEKGSERGLILRCYIYSVQRTRRSQFEIWFRLMSHYARYVFKRQFDIFDSVNCNDQILDTFSFLDVYRRQLEFKKTHHCCVSKRFWNATIILRQKFLIIKMTLSKYLNAWVSHFEDFWCEQTDQRGLKLFLLFLLFIAGSSAERNFWERPQKSR